MKRLEGGQTVAIQIGAKPDSGFDDPIGMLKDCHRRIERFLHILCVVAERAAGRGLTDEETAGVQAALRYFREGGQRHTADEEESLFPRLRAEPNCEDLPIWQRADGRRDGGRSGGTSLLSRRWTTAHRG